jgi:hypothetical protein
MDEKFDVFQFKLRNSSCLISLVPLKAYFNEKYKYCERIKARRISGSHGDELWKLHRVV